MKKVDISDLAGTYTVDEIDGVIEEMKRRIEVVKSRRDEKIKFRGMTRDGSWIIGDLYHGLNDEIYINHVVRNITGDGWINIQTIVHKETVGQWTTLKDRHERNIYEGDILCTWNDKPDGDLDTWDEEDWGYVVVNMTPEDGVCMGGWDWKNPDSVEHLRFLQVIGNIHDNKDLLKSIKGESK